MNYQITNSNHNIIYDHISRTNDGNLLYYNNNAIVTQINNNTRNDDSD